MPIPVLQMSNNASSTLASAISNVSLTCTLSAGSGALFPSPAANQYFLMTFVDAATQTLREIVQCTARSGDTLTIVRAQEGTTALAWNANDLAVNMITAGTLQTYSQISQVQNGQFNYAVDSGSANSVIITTTPLVTPPVDGMEVTFKAAAANTTSATVSFNGLTASNLLGQNGALLQGGEIVAGAMVQIVYSASLSRWTIVSKSSGPTPTSTATQTNQAVNLGQMTAAIALSTGRLLNIQYFTANGTYTPTSGTTSVVVELIGGGGAGGGIPTAAGSGAAGGGGGGGGYGRKRITSGFSGVTVTIGSGGTGVLNATGGNGATSSFGSLMTALGGNGGGVGSTTASSTIPVGSLGSGGLTTLADVTRKGGSGGTGLISSTFAQGGVGGDTMLAPQTQSKVNIVTGVSTGNSATANSGGGGTSATGLNSGITAAGGNGGSGICIVWEYS